MECVRVFRLKTRKLNPNKANVMFAQLLGTRDYIAYALGQFICTGLSRSQTFSKRYMALLFVFPFGVSGICIHAVE